MTTEEKLLIFRTLRYLLAQVDIRGDLHHYLNNEIIKLCGETEK